MMMMNSSSRSNSKCVDRCVNDCAARGCVCPYASWLASLHTTERVQKLRKDSHIFGSSFRGRPRFNHIKPHHLEMGPVLGTGGFSQVRECTLVSSSSSSSSSQPEQEPKLAVKYLCHETMSSSNRGQYMQGAADLATEAHFLQVLDHPHIVKLHGIRAGSIQSNVASGKEAGFFIVVDRLEETLADRLKDWRRKTNKKRNRSGGSNNKRSPSSSVHRQEQQRQRRDVEQVLEIATAIVDALNYLHSMGIVLRDLKPDNIGFDVQGNLKLFDFGLAKELKETRKVASVDGSSDAYIMTGQVGSGRYMAPEVVRQLPYDQSVDVYAFGVLLEELCEARGLFSSNDEDDAHLVEPKKKSKKTIVSSLQRLIHKCRSTDPRKRPDVATLETKLGKWKEQQSIASSSKTSTTQKRDQEPTEERHSLTR